MLSFWSARPGPRPRPRRPASRPALLRLEDRTVPATIAGVVYVDLNNNGLFDPGEPPVANSPIELRDSDGGLVNSGTTGPAGTYSFSTNSSIAVSPTSTQEFGTLPLKATDFATTVSIPQFDPALGTLTGVAIQLAGSVGGTVQFENLTSAPASVTSTLQAQLKLNRPDNTLLVSALPTVSQTTSVTPFDGVLDFGGTSGRTFAGLSGTDTKSAATAAAADLALFTGTGTVSLPITGTGLSGASGAGNLVTAFSTLAGADVTVTYTYLPNNAIGPGPYTVVQTAQPAGFFDGQESSGGVVRAGSVGTDTIPVFVESVADVLPDNNFGEIPITPALGVLKLTNGTDNNTAPGVFVPVGSTVTFTYVVTNTGNVPLAGVSVADDNGTPGFVSDDFSPAFAGGDTDGNGFLDLGETWTYAATRTATAGQYTNVATATGSTATGTATASDADNHFGAAPAIGLVKLTNGTDNNAAPGVLVPVGSNVAFTYVVTNPGNVPLSGVYVLDDNGTPADPADDFNAAFAGGDTDGNGLLDPSETWTFTASRVAAAGQYTNVGEAVGVPPPGAGEPVTATDPDNHFAAGAAVRLISLTGGRDNTSRPGPVFTVGRTITLVYLVSNPGTVPLSGVTVGDDDGTPGDPTDDFNATFAGGDADGNGRLDPGETWVFSAFRVVTPGPFTNTAVATALPPLGVPPVTSTDPDNHFGYVPVVAAGAGPGASPQVKLFNADGTVSTTIQAFDPGFLGGVRVAVGDVTGDHVADVIVGAGPGAGAHVKVFDGVTGAEVRSFFAFPGFSGGVFVAAGDVDGDGRADVIVGAGAGGAPHVKVVSGATGAEVRSFFAFAADFAGGVTVAAGDENMDGRADVVVGAGPGAGPHVKVFDAVTNAELKSFFAFAADFAGGVYVGAGDLDCDGRDEVVVGARAGPHVKVFDGATSAELRSFYAFPPSSAGGVRVACGEVNAEGMADLILGTGTGSEVKALDGLTTNQLFDVTAFGPESQGVYVG